MALQFLRRLRNKLRFVRMYTRGVGVWNLLRPIPGVLFFIAQEIRHNGAGILRDGNPLDSTLYGKLVRADANVRASVALGGTFVTSMGAITSLDVSVRSAQAAIEAKTLEIDDSRFERSARLGAPEIPYTWLEKRGYDRL